ncbi:hypothetical protein STRIP9103_08827, partial [Streptomyces ipomoeae 91-03]
GPPREPPAHPAPHRTARHLRHPSGPGRARLVRAGGPGHRPDPRRHPGRRRGPAHQGGAAGTARAAAAERRTGRRPLDTAPGLHRRSAGRRLRRPGRLRPGQGRPARTRRRDHRLRQVRTAADLRGRARRGQPAGRTHLRPRRLQGRQRLQGLRRPPAHPRHGHRPGQPSRPARADLAVGRTDPPRAHPGRGRRQGPARVPGHAPPEPRHAARAPAGHRHRRVRHPLPGDPGLHPRPGEHRPARSFPGHPSDPGHPAPRRSGQLRHPGQHQPADRAARHGLLREPGRHRHQGRRQHLPGHPRPCPGPPRPRHGRPLPDRLRRHPPARRAAVRRGDGPPGTAVGRGGPDLGDRAPLAAPGPRRRPARHRRGRTGRGDGGGDDGRGGPHRPQRPGGGAVRGRAAHRVRPTAQPLAARARPERPDRRPAPARRARRRPPRPGLLGPVRPARGPGTTAGPPRLRRVRTPVRHRHPALRPLPGAAHHGRSPGPGPLQRRRPPLRHRLRRRRAHGAGCAPALRRRGAPRGRRAP